MRFKLYESDKQTITKSNTNRTSYAIICSIMQQDESYCPEEGSSSFDPYDYSVEHYETNVDYFITLYNITNSKIECVWSGDVSGEPMDHERVLVLSYEGADTNIDNIDGGFVSHLDRDLVPYEQYSYAWAYVFDCDIPAGTNVKALVEAGIKQYEQVNNTYKYFEDEAGDFVAEEFCKRFKCYLFNSNTPILAIDDTNRSDFTAPYGKYANYDTDAIRTIDYKNYPELPLEEHRPKPGVPGTVYSKFKTLSNYINYLVDATVAAIHK